MTTTASKHVDPHLDIVFVHGLGSDDEAWLNKNTKFEWPTELQESDPRLRVLNITHHAPMFKIKNAGAVEAQFQQTATSFLNKLDNQKVGERPIVFVTHSLGGIIVKEALRVSQHRGDSILKKTRCVVFLSTPHAGAAVANAAGYLAPIVRGLGALAPMLGPFGILLRLVIEPVAFFVRSSSLTSQLKKNDAALLSLNYWYRSLSNIETHAFYETELTYRCVHVVDPASADPGTPSCQPIRADRKDHVSICKPADANDLVFVSVAKIIENVRDKERAGTDYPVFRKEIRDTLLRKEIREANLDPDKVGNFSDIPAANDVRIQFENLLRQACRARFKDGEPIDASQEQAAGKSQYDIDKFVLSLWLETKTTEQLRTLTNFISDARSSVDAKINAKEPPTLILLYRAARTLDRTLVELDYVTLKQTVARARETVLSRHREDKTFDTNKKTQDLLEKLELVACVFDEVKRNPAKFKKRSADEVIE